MVSTRREQRTPAVFADRKRFALLSGFGALISIATFVLLCDRAAEEHTVPEPAAPALFAETTRCPVEVDAFEHARRSEQVGRLQADRYPYDPSDGIRAVQSYQSAESCYRRAGSPADVRRVIEFKAAFALAVNTDYAASRLSLANALERRRWSAAFAEVRRLLRLTEHLGQNEYTEWLKNKVGRLAVRARTGS